MGSPKGPVLVGVSQNLLCLFTTLVPALPVQLHNNSTTLREKNEQLQMMRACVTLFLAGCHSKNVCP